MRHFFFTHSETPPVCGLARGMHSLSPRARLVASTSQLQGAPSAGRGALGGAICISSVAATAYGDQHPATTTIEDSIRLVQMSPRSELRALLRGTIGLRFV